MDKHKRVRCRCVCSCHPENSNNNRAEGLCRRNQTGRGRRKKRKNNTPNGKAFAAAPAEEAPWATVDLTLPRWALASASGYPNVVPAHSIKQYCNLPETTTAVCRNCVKKWENWIKSETQQKSNPGLFAGVANHPPAAAVAFCLFTLCLWFKAVLICPFDSFSSSSSPSLLSLYYSYDFLDYMLFVSSPTWFSLLVDSEARLLQSAQDSTAVPQPTMPKNEESKPVGMIKSSRV